MEVIFLQTVPQVAKKGEIKSVNDGFARNFLLPKKLAVISTPAEKAAFLKIKSQISKEDEAIQHKKASVPQQMEGQVLSFALKASATGTTFRQLPKESILQALETRFSMPQNNFDIQIEQPLKQVGDHKISVILDHHTINLIIRITNQNE
ncbi:MAG: 50S ribosomal protein L9 [Patescibacteria group bacterium]